MRILLVDNEPMYLNILAELLRLHGHSVLRAEEGEKAWETLKSYPVDLVISDISMPKMNGFSLHRLVRHDAHLAGTPFVLNSGYRELCEAVEVENAEIDYKLNKTFTIPGLLDIIKTVEKRLQKESPVMVEAG